MTFNYFGKIIRRYVGTGEIIYNKYKTEFELIQTSKGDIYAICKIKQFILSLEIESNIKLYGLTEDKLKIQFEGIEIGFTPGETTEIILKGNYINVGCITKKDNNLTIIFGITNLRILGTERYEFFEKERKCFALQYHFNLGGFDVYIRRIREYKEVIDILKSSKDIDITCTAEIRNVSIESIDHIKGIISNLCCLLSLAKGCNINWIYYDMFSEDAYIFSRHENRVTKTFGTLELIPELPGKDLEYFINKTYQRYAELKESLELEKAIAEFSDSKIESDYLEFRALKLTITVEHIKSCFLRIIGKEFIIDNEKFNVNSDQIVALIEKALKDIFIDEDIKKIELMAVHSKGFNYCTLGRALSMLCNCYKININSKERSRFKEIRDNLVHRVIFNNEIGTPWAQYCFLMTFVGRILLSVLDYDGYFYDWTKPPGYLAEDMEMRIKLERGR
ncbi:MAG: hypothetical protein FIA99_04255 [Ruminiclostridium sp.]|nr:hypothetical protein [Ruminiclostridium sp.]